MRSVPKTFYTSVLLSGVLLLGGCETFNNAPLTAQGALVGGGVGAATGAALGGTRGAAIGALAGAAVGGIGGNLLQNRQQNFASAEEELSVRTAEATRAAETQRAEAGQARRSAGTISRGLDGLVQQVSAGRRLNNDQAARLEAGKQERKRLQAAIANGQQAAAMIRRQASDLRAKNQDTKQLEAQAISMERSTAEMEESSKLYSSLSQIEA